MCVICAMAAWPRALAAVLLCLAALEHENVSWFVGHGAMPSATRDDEGLAGAERDRLSPLHLDTEMSVPAEEELVLLVLVPGELAVEPGYAEDRLIHNRQLTLLPRTWEGGDDLGDRCRARV